MSTIFLCMNIGFMEEVVTAQDDPTSIRRPNILLAIADDWSFGHASSYGCTWVQTPGFDRVAREGLLFTRCYTPNAKCAPSRACMLTGRNSWQLGAAANHVCFFPTEYKTWMEALEKSGYRAGHTAKGWGPGVSQTESNQPRPLTGTAFNSQTTQPPASGISKIEYAANFTAFLDSAETEQPWCFWYGALEPHRDYEFQSGVGKGNKKLSDISHVPGYWPDNETVRHDMLDYAFEVEHFDRHLSRMLDELERRGQLNNTLVIVTSDHGMPFPRCKGQAYDNSNHIPLAIMWGDQIRNPGRTVDDYISLIDLAPTIIQAAGIEWNDTGMQASPGQSLQPIFESARSGQIDSARDHVLIGKERHDVGRPDDVGYPIRGIIKNDVLYLRNYSIDRWPAGNPETGYLNCDGSPTKTVLLNSYRDGSSPQFWALAFGKRLAVELYDLKSDPDCLINLADESDWQDHCRILEEQMTRELTEQNDPRMRGEGDWFDRVPYVNEPHRDFHNRFMRGEKIRAGWVNDSDFEPMPEKKERRP